MAKLSMINREKKREKTVKKYATKRAELKSKAVDMTLSAEVRAEARASLQKLPRNAGPTRMKNRCKLTGRTHGYYRKFGLCRNKLREAAMRGDIPGLVKASW